MELMEVATCRRSIRDFKPGVEIDRETVEEILKAAQWAPSWKNSQTGRYYVALSQASKERILRNCLPEMNRQRAQNASALIVTAFEMGFSGFDAGGNPLDEAGNGWGAYDLGLQNQNLILRAKELGWDSLIMGIRNTDALRRLFAIPETQQIMAVIALGARNVDPEAPKRRELSEIVSFF